MEHRAQLIVSFMAAEVVVGILAHSLALLSDAAHMLTDAGALLMSLIVIRLIQKPAEGNLTFGLKRAEIFSAGVRRVGACDQGRSRAAAADGRARRAAGSERALRLRES